MLQAVGGGRQDGYTPVHCAGHSTLIPAPVRARQNALQNRYHQTVPWRAVRACRAGLADTLRVSPGFICGALAARGQASPISRR